MSSSDARKSLEPPSLAATHAGGPKRDGLQARRYSQVERGISFMRKKETSAEVDFELTEEEKALYETLIEVQKKQEQNMELLEAAVFKKERREEIIQALKEPDTRADLYDAWSEKLFLRELQHHGDSKLVQLILWFTATYTTFVLGPVHSLVRIKCFATIQSALTGVRPPTKALRRCCEHSVELVQPTELFRMLAIDLQFWLYKVRNGAIQGDHVARSLDLLTYEEPKPYMLEKAHSLFVNEQQRTDAYISVVDVIATILEQDLKRFEKLMFLIGFLNEKLTVHPPSALLVPALQRRLLAAGFSTDAEVSSSLHRLQANLDNVLEQWMSVEARTGIAQPPIFSDAQKTAMRSEAVPTEPRPASAHYVRKKFCFAEPDTVIGSVSDIWLSIEGMSFDRHEPAQTFESQTAGLLQFMGAYLTWTGQAGTPEEVEIVVRFADVERFTATDATGARPTLNLLLSNRVVRLFPFHPAELPEVLAAMTDLVGVPADSEADFTAHMREARELQWRTQTHQELTRQQRWLITVQQLQDLVGRMLEMTRPLDEHDMELLYHSCRQNEEVSMEALLYLKKVWYTLTAEPMRLRLLQIVERLVDPRVLPPHMPHLRELLQWLTTVERQLDPYKSPGSMRAVIALRKTAEQLRNVPVLQQLESEALKDGFDLLPEYDKFQQRSLQEPAVGQEGRSRSGSEVSPASPGARASPISPSSGPAAPVPAAAGAAAAAAAGAAAAAPAISSAAASVPVLIPPPARPARRSGAFASADAQPSDVSGARSLGGVIRVPRRPPPIQVLPGGIEVTPPAPMPPATRPVALSTPPTPVAPPEVPSQSAAAAGATAVPSAPPETAPAPPLPGAMAAASPTVATA